jgi:DNA polymerase I
MIRMMPALHEANLKARMLLQVHDELIFECPESETNQTIPLVQKVMTQAPEPALKLSVRLQVDARAAQNWDEAH